ncbi:glycosyltransferase family 4 protein [Krasilnikoviella flava]|uniref:Glycosyltransferase involved in cell wall bisynthesis n=1 Tax=Krasilnikoviella flava TaxID=526729 RepID=A0A1T5IN60_9MICO|nr:glycosyltransferase family 4 protein [Krasilnikoviella flava]SKC40606.1 Glycosyltransferase involved in cell wall bisynthesis [Krasilnikoviella flava]
MRVAYVSSDPGVPVFGRKGSSVHVQAVLRELVRAGAEVHVVTTRPGADTPDDLADVVVHRILVAPTGSTAAREVALREADAQVGGILSGIAAGESFDLVYERYSLWGSAATAWAREADVPSVLEVNAPLVAEQRTHRELVDEAGAERCARAAIGAATAVVAVSGPVAAWAAERAGAHPQKVHVLANGVDTTRITPVPEGVGGRRALPDSSRGRVHGRQGALHFGRDTSARRARQGATAFTVLFVGTLKPWHGLDVLVDAFAGLRARVPDARLLLVGDGPEREAVLARADALGTADAVEHAGAVAPSEVPALLHRADVAVAPYPPLEHFYFSPLKVYEYLAAGLPVVASAVGELPDALEHGGAGVLVPPGDAAALADALVGLAHDPDRRAALGARARAVAVERHDWSVVVRRALGFAGVPLVEAVPSAEPVEATDRVATGPATGGGRRG